MLRYLVILILLGHGLGHAMGFLAAWTNVPVGFTRRPWLLSAGVTVQSAVGRAFGMLWLVALIFFVGTAYGLLTRQVWWADLAVAASVISLVAILPWFNTVPPGARFGAILVDVVVIAALVLPWAGQVKEAIGG